MEEDKRTGQPPIPDNLEDWLNKAQLQSLRKLENLGFRLIFMRRPMFRDPVPIAINDRGNKLGILEKDGRLNMEVDIAMRSESNL